MNPSQGMVTLWVTTLLVIATTVLGWMTLQSIFSESTRSQQQMFAAQALATSEALLETVLATLESAYAHNDVGIDALVWSQALAAHCPATKPSPQWQCLRWSLTDLPLPEFIDVTASQVRLLRDVRYAPHKIKISVEVTLNNQHPGAGSRATVQQVLWIPLTTPFMPLQEVSTTQDSQTTTDCPPLQWQKAFGNLSPSQLKAISLAQTQSGLSAHSFPARSIYWTDSPLTWTSSLGTTLAPVVLVFSELACSPQCPQLASSAAVIGTVFFQSQCAHFFNTAEKANPALTFSWPEGIDTSKVQRISGSWKNAAY